MADLPYPILGIDFLNPFNLLEDVRRQRLVHGSMSLAIPVRVSSDTVYNPSFFTAAASNQINGLLTSFPVLVNPTFKSVQVKHITTHILFLHMVLLFSLDCNVWSQTGL